MDTFSVLAHLEEKRIPVPNNNQGKVLNKLKNKLSKQSDESSTSGDKEYGPIPSADWAITITKTESLIELFKMDSISICL